MPNNPIEKGKPMTEELFGTCPTCGEPTLTDDLEIIRANLVIGDNRWMGRAYCPFCGLNLKHAGHNAPGPQLLLNGTTRCVCHDCGDKYAPELMAELRPQRQAYEAKMKAEYENEISFDDEISF